jgi:hypothetical protein
MPEGQDPEERQMRNEERQMRKEEQAQEAQASLAREVRG